jgi:chemotaxis protein methyltransferase CheR
VKHTIKTPVIFQYHDLISGPKKHNLDLIFCRNVVIYFTRQLQEVLYKDFYNALNPGGFFIMGKTETLVGESRDLFIPYNLNERIFRKR